MAVKKIILIRHGELPPEFSGRFVGSTDAPLGEHGIADCRALAGIWRAMKSEITFVSPKLRALQTAELICGSVPAVKDDAIREIDFGKWENLTFEEIAGANPEYSKYWYDHPDEIHFPEGESVQLFNLRVEAFTEMLLELPQNVITVISHGGVLTAMIRRLMDLPCDCMWRWQPSRGSLSVINFDPQFPPGRFGVFNLKPLEFEGWRA